jgi:hypothetical protein
MRGPHLDTDPVHLPVRLSTHARRRFKQRSGLPIRAVGKAAATALARGRGPEALPRGLRLKLTNSIARHTENRGKHTFARVHRGFAFIFVVEPAGATDPSPILLLVTVLPDYQLHFEADTE